MRMGAKPPQNTHSTHTKVKNKNITQQNPKGSVVLGGLGGEAPQQGVWGGAPTLLNNEK